MFQSEKILKHDIHAHKINTISNMLMYVVVIYHSVLITSYLLKQ